MNFPEIRQALEFEGQRLVSMRDDLRSGDELSLPENIESGGELSVVDQHPADVATETMQREIDLSLLEKVEAELEDVERALQKLSDGTYGRCEACSNQIDEDRLVAQPAARFCLNDQALAESEALQQTPNSGLGTSL